MGVLLDNYPCKYPGSFMRMKIQVVKNETIMQINPTAVMSMRLSLGVSGEWMWSKMINPRPPVENRKLEASPSMMYCPLTRYGMKAT